MLELIIQIWRNPRRLSPFDLRVLDDFLDSEFFEMHMKMMKECYKGGEKDEEEGEEKRCSICQDDVAREAQIVHFPLCTHPFHLECFEAHYNRNKWCPMCRRTVKEAMVELLQRELENHREKKAWTIWNPFQF